MNRVPLQKVKLTDGFWQKKQELCGSVTLPAIYRQFTESGRFAAVDFSAPLSEEKPLHIFWDSDVVKWMEGACYELVRRENPALRAEVEDLLAKIEANQQEDGYFNLYFQRVAPGQRFTNRDKHELYCLGHMAECAVAYYEATGSMRFLRVVEKYVDLVIRLFCVEGSAAFVTPGHEEIELALFRCYRATGKEKYRDLALWFLERRGNNDREERDEYSQSHLPIGEQRSLVGHAVRAMYLCSAMADAAMLCGREDWLVAARALFEDAVKRKMYVTGALGSTHHGEAFSVPYYLPDTRAYAETCASIGMVFFADRMIDADPAHAAEYADVIERELFNSVLAGVSLSGDLFFYCTPLAFSVAEQKRLRLKVAGCDWLPRISRPPLLGCSCCPPNLTRLLASLAPYFLRDGGESVTLLQFASLTAELEKGKITVETDYPNSGRVAVHTEGVATLRIRKPGWCASFTASAPYTEEDGFLVFAGGDVTVDFAMPVRLAAADSRVRDCIGKRAVLRGPVVYCAEGLDQTAPLFAHFVAADTDFAELPSDYGVPVLRARGFVQPESETLYAAPPALREAPLTFIPYFAMENRGETDMAVWIPVK